MTELPRARGKRPVFTVDAAVDDVIAMLLALTQEVAVLRERCDTAERLVQAGVLGATAIEDFQPDAAAGEAREQWRADYLDRVLWIMRARAEETASPEPADASYDKVIALVGGRAA